MVFFCKQLKLTDKRMHSTSNAQLYQLLSEKQIYTLYFIVSYFKSRDLEILY